MLMRRCLLLNGVQCLHALQCETELLGSERFGIVRMRYAQILVKHPEE